MAIRAQDDALVYFGLHARPPVTMSDQNAHVSVAVTFAAHVVELQHDRVANATVRACFTGQEFHHARAIGLPLQRSTPAVAHTLAFNISLVVASLDGTHGRTGIENSNRRACPRSYSTRQPAIPGRHRNSSRSA
jgi:hypothetical protein